jgi:Double zinc ribbon
VGLNDTKQTSHISRVTAMRCATCGSENPVGKKFCGDCGVLLASSCPKCAAESPPGKQFCGDCGAALAGAASPSLTGANPEAAGQREAGTARRLGQTAAAIAASAASSHQVRNWIRGNLIRRRILGVVFAFAVFSGLAFLYVYFIKPTGREISPKEFIRTGAASMATLISSTASLFGVVDKRREPPPTHSRLVPSFKSGLYGGVIGGALSGLIIGVVYYIEARNDGVGWERIPVVFAFASAAGTLFGASIQAGILVLSRVPTNHYSGIVINEVTGGILGGLIGGILAGALGGPLFYSMSGPFVSLPLVIGGSAIGGFCVVLGTLVYDYGGRWRDIFPAMLASAVITAFPVGIGYFALNHWQTLPGPPANMDPIFLMLIVGAVIGLAVGVILGMEVGLTLRVFSSMQPKTAAEN